MEDIIHVKPYGRQETKTLESLITPSPYISPIPPVELEIPISNQVDITQILQTTAKFTSQSTKDKIQVDELSLKVHKFKDIEQLQVDNYYDQISLVVFTQFKLDNKLFIELLFNQFISDYHWSFVKNFESVTVMLKVNNLKDLCTLNDNVELFKSVSEKVLIKMPVEEIGDIEVSKKTIEEAKILQLVSDLIEKNKNNDKSSDEKTNVSLDNYYNSYPVDANELIDVPKLMKNKIINELIKFRSRMLIKEHQKRQSELNHERIKAKQLLTNIFNNEDRVKDDDMVVDAIVEPPEEMAELNDQGYEDYLNQKLETEMSAKYHDKLRQIAQQKLQKNTLQNKVNQLTNYEMDLINNKFKLIDNLKAGSQSYHDYIRYKYKSYQAEEIRDNEDRSQDTETSAEPKEPSTEEPKEDHKEENEEENKESTEIKELPPLNEEQKSKLQHKLGELVEQYIGIKEDELIQFLYDNLVAHSLTREEAYETFDNDTDNLINEINQFIQTL